jgi:DNA-binding PadR family transcriptional regulator
MARPDSLQGSIDLLVMKILSRRPRLHGYAIISAIQDMSSEVLRVEEGSLYPALHRMKEADWTIAGKKATRGGRVTVASPDFSCESRPKNGLICRCCHVSPMCFAGIV